MALTLLKLTIAYIPGCRFGIPHSPAHLLSLSYSSTSDGIQSDNLHIREKVWSVSSWGCNACTYSGLYCYSKLFTSECVFSVCSNAFYFANNTDKKAINQLTLKCTTLHWHSHNTSHVLNASPHVTIPQPDRQSLLDGELDLINIGIYAKVH